MNDQTPGPIVLWKRAVAPDQSTWVRIDGRLVVGDALFDLPTGERINARASAFPRLASWTDVLARPQVESAPGTLPPPSRASPYQWVRRWDGLVVVAQRDGEQGRGLKLAVVDPLTGKTVRKHRARPGDEGDMWRLWLQQRDGTLGFGTYMPGKDLAVPDPATGRVRWRTPWRPIVDERAVLPAAEPADAHGRALLVNFCDYAAGRFRYTTALFADTDGSLLWRAFQPIGTVAEPCVLAGDHVVTCLCPQAETRYWHEHGHGSGGPSATVTVEVRARASGKPLWTHAWPWRPEQTPRDNALMVRGNVLIIREAEGLCARSLADGQVLWIRPIDAAESDPTAVAADLAACRTRLHSPARWAWIRQLDLPSPGSGDLVVHTISGDSLELPGVFHHTDDDLVLTRTADTLTCLALPAGPHPGRLDAAAP